MEETTLLPCLPNNVWEVVVSYLDAFSLRNLSLTSRFFAFLAENVDWNEMCKMLPRRHLNCLVHTYRLAESDLIYSDLNLSSKKLCIHYSTCFNVSSSAITERSSCFQKNLPKVSATEYCCGYLLVGFIDGSVGIFDSKSLRRVKWCERWHNGPVVSLHCHCGTPFRKFPSLVISTGTDSCIKFTRYDNTYLQFGEPWTLPCASSPITASAKFGRYILVGQGNGDVRLVSIRLAPSSTSTDEGKQGVSAGIVALYTDVRRGKITAVAFNELEVVVSVTNNGAMGISVLHIDHEDVPLQMRLVEHYNAYIHPSIVLEARVLLGNYHFGEDHFERVKQVFEGLLLVKAYGPIFICVDKNSEVFIITSEDLRTLLNGTVKTGSKKPVLNKTAIYNSMTMSKEWRVSEFTGLAFGYTTAGFTLSLSEFNNTVEDINIHSPNIIHSLCFRQT